MSEPHVAQNAPIALDVEGGKTYWWCACGLSAKQPFCDGSHKTTDLTPLAWTAPETTKVWFCACKATGNKPLCDGSHKRL